MSETAGYILRIASEKWVDRVFEMAIYYTNVRRNWKSGQTALFLHRTQVGDAFVGYGLIDKPSEMDDLNEEEKRDCQEGGWKTALEFQYVKRFDDPLPIKETFLKDTRLRGRYFHGLGLSRHQLHLIMEAAGQFSPVSLGSA
jgi:hypothetical protein